ncbi:MAG: putative baseplate assembly protein [Acidobacteriia bacterium]|nr:putative baseplate assembly protein [Terriglobia bacterium]
MNLCCQRDERREAVRQLIGWNGLDYVEVVDDDQLTLNLYFLGKLPPELSRPGPGLEKYLRLEGGRRVTGIRIVHVDPVTDPDTTRDEYLTLTVEKYGDFSTYTLRLVGVERVDPQYDHVDFSFKINCPSDLDCAPSCLCEPPAIDEPEINYLAKDYGSFRQLILDHISLLAPGWKETHAADIGMALVELLAYTGDYLSYYQDAVATEAYLNTARRRISVRRHARLVDYLLHEGCNARTWVCIEATPDLKDLDLASVSFITGLNDALTAQQTVLSWDDLREVKVQDYEVFEPLWPDRTAKINLLQAHNEIHFYTFGERDCCIPQGSTSATLLDAWVAESPKSAGTDQAVRTTGRRLNMKAGDVLIFEEVLGPVTGLTADADPAHRHAVRLTAVIPGEDPVLLTDGLPTPYLTIEWAQDDALPFPFCVSAITQAPDCFYLGNVSVARGNVILVDHGKTQDSEDLDKVPAVPIAGPCECEEEPGDVQIVPGRFSAYLKKSPITFRQPPPEERISAIALLKQDARCAMPDVQITPKSAPDQHWTAQHDLLESRPGDRHFVVEIDNDGVANLRFGDGEMGAQPAPGEVFESLYRTGNGAAGNVGAESITRLVLKGLSLSGYAITVRNPLPAVGGTEPEPMAEAKLFAPHLFRKQLKRAITAGDYAELAQHDLRLQRAAASLVWTGSWYEADVAIDPRGSEAPGEDLLKDITKQLECFRRMGHDLAVLPAEYVPIDLNLTVCALPDYVRGQVKAALLDVFSNRALPGGNRGFFHPDNLTFGEGLYLSRIIAAAQAVPGVQSVSVGRFQRLFDQPNGEIENGVLPLGATQVAQLDNDPNNPEHGKLEIEVCGGR